MMYSKERKTTHFSMCACPPCAGAMLICNTTREKDDSSSNMMGNLLNRCQTTTRSSTCTNSYSTVNDNCSEWHVRYVYNLVVLVKDKVIGEVTRPATTPQFGVAKKNNFIGAGRT